MEFQATFSLLQPPSFDVLPDTDVQLGSIHPQTQAKPRRPDTKRILNRSTRVPVPNALYRTRIDPLVTLDSGNLKTNEGNFGIHLPIIQGIGGGFAAAKTNETVFYIQAQNVETQWFLPDDAYFAQTLESITVQKELLNFRTPPVFLITGVKIAETATIISGHRKASTGEIGPEIDLTSFGVPVEVAAAMNASRENFKIVPIRKTKFLLAFEARKIKVKKDGYLEEDANDFAMLDDEEIDRKTLSESLREKLELDEYFTDKAED